MAYVEKIKVGTGEAWDLRDAEAQAAIEKINGSITNINNSIASINNAIPSITSIMSTVYPVGSIYMSVNGTSPATLFGFGTWEQLKDRFLLGAGSTYTNGSTGGEAAHTLTVDELPSHNHVGLYESSNNGVLMWQSYNGGSDRIINGNTHSSDGTTPDIYTGSTGGGKAHNNMPPYLVVYMWKRTA